MNLSPGTSSAGSASLAAALVIALACVVPAASATTPVAPPKATQPLPSTPTPADNAVKQLFDAHQFPQAVQKADELRALAKGGKIADPDSEYWAARSLFAQRKFEEARKRYEEVAAAYPNSARGPEAAVGGFAAQLAPLGDRPPAPGDKELATRVARGLDELSRRYETSRPDVASKAAFVGANSWRMAGDDKATGVGYERTRQLQPMGEFAGRATQLLASLDLRRFDVEAARAHYSECATKFAGQDVGTKCGQSLAEMQLVGKPAPPFTVETWLNGEQVQPATLRGKVVLVWFFSTTSPHCQTVMPQVAAFVDKYKGKDFWVVGLTNNGEGQTTESARAFIADPKWGFTYPVGLDRNGATMAAYPTSGTPSAILVDKKGIIRWADAPSMLSADMIARLLAE